MESEDSCWRLVVVVMLEVMLHACSVCVVETLPAFGTLSRHKHFASRQFALLQQALLTYRRYPSSLLVSAPVLSRGAISPSPLAERGLPLAAAGV